VDEISLRTLFHGALDEVAPPKPWLGAAVREEMNRRRVTLKSRRGLRLLNPAVQRAIAAVLVVLIAVGAAVAAVAIYEQRHHGVPVIPAPRGPVSRTCGNNGGSVRMFDKDIGWRGTERTTDGGRTWRDVSPPYPPGWVKGGGATCTLNPDIAWVSYGFGSVPYQPTKLVLMSTHDAGQSWQQDGVIPVPWSLSWRTNFSVLLDFYDLQHGWLFMEYATQPLQRRVYATSDAGQSWSLVSAKPDLGLGNLAFDCSQTGLMFDSPQRGWLTWGCSSGFGDTPPSGAQVIATTNDGGRTWAPVQLVGMPSGSGWSCDATSPIFTGSQSGVFQITCSGIGRSGTTALYSSVDGGKTWSFHPFSHFTTVDFIDGTTGYYFAQEGSDGPNTLFRTDDGGGHWVVVAKGLFQGKNVGGLNFIDDKTGFVGVSDSPAPWWTFDGGKTWALPSPYRSAGNTVCDVFRDLGAGFQLPQSVKMASPTVGWAPGTRRTTDGGVHWTNVAPPSPKYRDSGYGEFFLDADHAWVVDAVGTTTACADRFVVYGTSNGGASWQLLSTDVVRGLKPSDALSGSWTVRVEFIDPQHGWVLVQPMAGFSRGAPGPLYGTTDGGKTWSLEVSSAMWSSEDCSGSGLPLFSSPTTGWISDVCTGPTRSSLNLLVTRDGGQTWSNLELLKNYCDATAYPTGCQIGGPLPQFFDADNGWLLDTGSQVLLMTSDGGQTWTHHGLPRGSTYTCQGKYGPTTCSTLYVEDGSFVSPSDGWAVASVYLGSGSALDLLVEHTVDGGKTWAVVNRRHTTTESDQGEFFQFVDSSHGFWWFGNTVTATTDGGRSWAAARVVYS